MYWISALANATLSLADRAMLAIQNAKHNIVPGSTVLIFDGRQLLVRMWKVGLSTWNFYIKYCCQITVTHIFS